MQEDSKIYYKVSYTRITFNTLHSILQILYYKLYYKPYHTYYITY